MECYNFKCLNRECGNDRYKMAACLSRKTKKQAALVKTIDSECLCSTCYSKMIAGKLKYSKKKIKICTKCGAIKEKENIA